MNFRNLSIESIAWDPAPERVSSVAIEDRLHPALSRLRLPLRPIELLTGIRERRYWPAGTQLADTAAGAGRLAIAQAGVHPGEIGLLLNTSVSRDRLEPSIASLVHGKLGLSPRCRNLDVANACLGFINGIELAGQLIEGGVIDYALLVDGEDAGPVVERTLTRLLAPEATAQDFWGDFATLTLGSTAVAMVLGRADRSRTTHRVRGSVGLAATEHAGLCVGTNERMVTDSTRLLRAGVELARRTWALAEEELPAWGNGTIDQYICHQVGRAHLNALCDALGMDVAKCFLTYPEHGNVGPAAVPLTLLLAAEAGRVKAGDHVGLMGIGSGLNVAMMSVVW